MVQGDLIALDGFRPRLIPDHPEVLLRQVGKGRPETAEQLAHRERRRLQGVDGQRLHPPRDEDGLGAVPLAGDLGLLEVLGRLVLSRNSGVVTTNHSGRKPKNSPRATREARTWRKGSAWRFTA